MEVRWLNPYTPPGHPQDYRPTSPLSHVRHLVVLRRRLTPKQIAVQIETVAVDSSHMEAVNPQHKDLRYSVTVVDGVFAPVYSSVFSSDLPLHAPPLQSSTT